MSHVSYDGRVYVRANQHAIFQRLWRKTVVDPKKGCWLWCGFETDKGYGKVKVDGRMRRVHRVSAEIFLDPWNDPSLVTDHLCRVRRCWNPLHLEMVPQKINVDRGVGPAHFRDATHCKRGHEFTPENTKPVKGGRSCRTCLKAHETRHKALARERTAARREGREVDLSKIPSIEDLLSSVESGRQLI